jgi:very-short-patch-repair endonuclease
MVVQKNRAKQLRKNSTDAERLLWRVLRSRQVAGYKFRRQQPLDEFIVDFVCLEKRLVVEVDGGQHNEPLQAEHDSQRSA